MKLLKVEKIIYYIVRIGAYLLPFTLLIIANSMFFPFVSGKNFAFRVIVEIMTAAWAGLLIVNFKKYWPKRGLFATAFAVFVAVMFISALFGVNFSQSFWSNFERMDGVITQFHLFALFLVLAGTFRTRREWFSIFAVSIFVSVIVAGYGFLEYLGKISYDQKLHSRIISTLGNPLYVAAYLSFHIFLLFYLLAEVKKKWLKWLLAAVFIFEFLVFFLTESRGAFIAVIVGASIILLSHIFLTVDIKKQAVSFKKKIVFVCLALILVTSPLIINLFKGTEFISNNRVLSRFSTIDLKAGQGRFIIWGMAWAAFKEKPILGWGSENFIVPFGKYYDPRALNKLEPWYDRTHNMFFEWLVAGGAVGFAAYIFLIFAVFWTIFKASSVSAFSKKQTFIFAGMLWAYLIQVLFVFDTLATYLTFVFLAGFFFAARSYPEEWAGKSSFFRVLKNNKEKVSSTPKMSASRFSALASVFVLTLIVLYFTNLKPVMANRTLMLALSYFNHGQIGESYESFQAALKLARGTVGETETAEHMVLNSYNLFQNPELLRSPEGENFYRLAKDALEAEVEKNSKKYPNIKHNILRGQLYHQKALLDNNAGVLQKAFENYEKVIFDAAPNYVSVYPIYANLLAQTGNLAGAIILTEKAVEILESVGGNDELIFYSQPLFYTAAKRYDDAYQALEKIVQKNEKLSPEKMETIVLNVRAHGREAVSFLSKISDLDKKLTSAPLMLAQIYVELGEREMAKMYALEALGRDPSIKDKVDEFLGMVDSELDNI